jgi:hypothetical protein
MRTAEKYKYNVCRFTFADNEMQSEKKIILNTIENTTYNIQHNVYRVRNQPPRREKKVQKHDPDLCKMQIGKITQKNGLYRMKTKRIFLFYQII